MRRSSRRASHGRKLLRQAALLEMRGEQRKADQQQEQIDEDHPLVTRSAPPDRRGRGPPRTPVTSHLIRDDGGEARGRDRQRQPMEKRDARERHAEDVGTRTAKPTGPRTRSSRRRPHGSRHSRGPFQARPRTKRPGRAAVGSPFSSASTPFTMTCGDARRVLVRFGVGRVVLDPRGIEDDDVGEPAGLQEPAVAEVAAPRPGCPVIRWIASSSVARFSSRT